MEDKLYTLMNYYMHHSARGIVGRVTDCRVRGIGFKSPGSILTSRTETSSLSRVVRNGWDPCSVPLSGVKKSLTWPLSHFFSVTTVQKTTQKQQNKNIKTCSR